MLLVSALALLGAAHAQGLDLRGTYNPNVWRPSSVSNAFAGMSLARSRPSTGSLHLFSDYYFYDPSAHPDSALGPTVGSVIGGFRASTGVAGASTGPSLFDNQPDVAQNLPYLGVGYSHLWLNNTLSLNADLGLRVTEPLGGEPPAAERHPVAGGRHARLALGARDGRQRQLLFLSVVGHPGKPWPCGDSPRFGI